MDAEHLLDIAALADAREGIRQGLEQDPSGDLPRGLFLRLLRYTLNEEDAERALRVAIEWGRYGNVFEYDFNTGVIRMAEDASTEPT